MAAAAAAVPLNAAATAAAVSDIGGCPFMLYFS
jgi:hypothetical protein